MRHAGEHGDRDAVVRTPQGRLFGCERRAAADVTVSSPAWANGAAANTMTGTRFAEQRGWRSPFQTRVAAASKTQNGRRRMVNNITILATGPSRHVGAGQTRWQWPAGAWPLQQPKGLVKLGRQQVRREEAAGLPNIARPHGWGGHPHRSALEQSNVDIAQEFTQMILRSAATRPTPRPFTVSDELLADTLAIKR